jgi:hypothetical protein
VIAPILCKDCTHYSFNKVRSSLIYACRRHHDAFDPVTGAEITGLMYDCYSERNGLCGPVSCGHDARYFEPRS